MFSIEDEVKEMTTLYVTSLESYSGKSALCLGLALRLMAQGIEVSYMKPLGRLGVKVNDQYTDEDALFIWKALGIEEDWELACPVLLTTELVECPLEGPVTGLAEKVQEAHQRLSRDCDLLIMEGPTDLAQGMSLGIPPAQVAALTDAKMVLVTRYHPSLSLDGTLSAKAILGESLIGAVVNDAPKDKALFTQECLVPFLARHRLKLYGVLPRDRMLMSITIGELSKCVGGEVLCCEDKLGELVDNFMVGAMNVDAALKYFRRTPNKAVITGGDRADIQLAALETSTKCLILSGNLYPDAAILGKATEMGVPMILVKTDTMRTVGAVERAMGRIRLSNPQQVKRVEELVEEHIDLAALRKGLGLS